MKLLCPQCRAEIPLADVNVANDLALCRRCERNFGYHELAGDLDAGDVDVTRPPKGAWHRQTARGFETGVSTRSPIAFFLVPFLCVWSGGALGGIYGQQIVKGEFNLMLSLFGIPFVLGTVLVGGLALMAVAGKIVVRVEGGRGEIFTGVGPVGWHRRFHWAEVTAIKLTTRRGSKGRIVERLTIEAGRSIHLASGVREERRKFLLGALSQMRREHVG